MVQGENARRCEAVSDCDRRLLVITLSVFLCVVEELYSFKVRQAVQQNKNKNQQPPNKRANKPNVCAISICLCKQIVKQKQTVSLTHLSTLIYLVFNA